MTSILATPGAVMDRSRTTMPRVVLCGSFRRDLAALSQDRDELLDAGCVVLSPADLEFVSEERGFVKAAHELARHPAEIEADHLRAIEEADFVWLHGPDGYVGKSGAMELGYASALGVPVYTRQTPVDVALQALVTIARDPRSAAERSREARGHTPSRPLDVLQNYYGRAAAARGYDHESPQDTMLLLTEEIGELARAVRKSVGLVRHGKRSNEDPALELADVQLYLLHLANVLDVRLGDAVAAKERVNSERFLTSLTEAA